MSTPPVTGRVILITSIGDIDCELYCTETPLACRNFIGLCYQGYYNGCKFHRVVKNWLVQTGDATNTGQGGDSIYEHQPYKREIHSRLKFNRRGMLGTASDENGLNLSQFFITLTRADALTGKHTCFGALTSTTVYNLSQFNDLEVDASDRPSNPPFIIRTDVIINPFTDLKPPPSDTSSDVVSDTSKSKRSSKQPVKNTVLSFYDDDEESIIIPQANKPIISSKNHKSTNMEATLIIQPPIVPSSIVRTQVVDQSPDIKLADQPVEKQSTGNIVEANAHVDDWAAEPNEAQCNDIVESIDTKSEVKQSIQLQMKREIAELTTRLFGAGNKDKQSIQTAPITKVSALEQMRSKYSKPAIRPTDVMSKLDAFKQKLRSAPQQSHQSGNTKDDDSQVDASEKKDSNWLQHRISFQKRPQDFQQSDAIEGRDFEVYDSRDDSGNKRLRRE